VDDVSRPLDRLGLFGVWPLDALPEPLDDLALSHKSREL
jgi:hypothetical protein